MEIINPLIMHNKDEIFSRERALNLLELEGTSKNALYAFSGHPGDFERYKKKYSFLENEGYNVFQASIYGDTIFPLIKYFNAFDMIICGAGYNQVWEAVFFNKKAYFETTPIRFSDQSLRIKESEKFNFTINGADQLVDIIMNL